MLSRQEVKRDIVIFTEMAFILAMLGGFFGSEGQNLVTDPIRSEPALGRASGRASLAQVVFEPVPTSPVGPDLETLVSEGRACNTGEGYVVCGVDEQCETQLRDIDFGGKDPKPGVPTQYAEYVCTPAGN